MACPHCAWTTKDIGLELDRPQLVPDQLSKLKREDSPFARSQTGQAGDPDRAENDPKDQTSDVSALDDEKQFANLKAFYTSQLARSAASGSSGDISNVYKYGSPGALARLVGLYTGMGAPTSKNQRGHKGMMREACEAEEGLKVLDDDDDDEVIQRMKQVEWGDRMWQDLSLRGFEMKATDLTMFACWDYKSPVDIKGRISTTMQNS